MKGIELVQSADTSYLDDRLDLQGRIKLLAAGAWHEVDPMHLRIWCQRHARYSVPTLELVDWLFGTIDGRSAIEIGAGMGDLGLRLGIPMTDSAVQVGDAKWYYEQIKCPPTDPPADVERLEAMAAIAKYRPRVVIGAWVTNRYVEGSRCGSVFGPDENEILANVETYIHIGNNDVHGEKPINRRAHVVDRLPSGTWGVSNLISRAKCPSRNMIQTWLGGLQ